MYDFGTKLAGLYENRSIQGWAGKELADRQFDLISDSFVEFPKELIYGASRKAFLWEFSRKLLGKDIPTITQKIGSCVSEGAKNAVDYLSCYEIVRLNQAEDFRPVFAPYYYGTGRVYVGQNRLGNQDGSLGSWMAKAVMTYGSLFVDEPGVPAYDGNIAKQWGSSKAVLDQWLPTAKQYLIKSAAKITTFEQVIAANTNGYPVTIASNQGFSMLPNAAGFHEGQGEWQHQMCALPQTLIKSLLTTTIDKISVGDMVFGHDGKLHSVTKVFKREYSGKIIKIRTWGGIPLCITPLHPVLVLSPDYESSDYVESSDNSNILVAIPRKVKKWISAKDLRVNDVLLCPFSIYNINIPKPTWIGKGGRNYLNDFDLTDKDISWFVGLYAADGGAVKSHKITITLDIDQIEVIERCKKVIEKLGLRPTVKVYEKYVRVIAYSARLANSFLQWFGKKNDKHLPDWVFVYCDPKEVLSGLFDGDGNFATNGTTKRIVNCSTTLIDQTYSLLLTLGEKPYITIHHYDDQPTWNDRYIIEWIENPKKKSYTFWDENNYCSPVREISQEKYTGDVYNLEVEGANSFIANQITVHNCIIAADAEYAQPYAGVINSWGPSVHGTLKDFHTGENWPPGMLRVREPWITHMLKTGEAYVYSQFQGFPSQDLRKYLRLI